MNRARIAALDGEIIRLKELAKQLEKDVSFRGTALYGEENRHAEGWYSDPTGRAAVQDLPEDVRQLYEDIRRMTIERNRTAAWVALADQALAILPRIEKLVVELRAIDGLSWADVGDEVYERTERDYSEVALRNIFKRALNKIRPFFFDAQ